MVNSVHKGKRGENEFCDWLHKNFKLDFIPERNYNVFNHGGSDIVEVYNFAFEIKRREFLDLQSWWYQAIISARELNREPVVAFRQNHKAWEFLISANNIGVETGFLRLRENTFVEYAKLAIKGHV